MNPMMSTTRFLLAITLICFASCGTHDGNDASITTGNAGSATAATVVPTNATPPAQPTMPLNLNGLRSVGTGNASGMNPEHGNPGHRCDIAVGAPLNTPISTNTNANTTQMMPQAVSLPGPSNANTPAPGTNPEHGKPGHRCDIAVGAPLNSKPANDLVKAPVPTPAIPAAKPGINPQHGQPGHRCDIAVGAPLNSKPIQGLPTVPAPDTSGL
jgi:hypothetical protein